jgi:serine protease AprX
MKIYSGKSITHWLVRITLLLGLVLSVGGVTLAQGGPPQKVVVIVQGRSLGAAANAARAHGGKVTHELGIINAVGVEMPETALNGLRHNPHVIGIYENRSVHLVSDSYTEDYPDTAFPELTQAHWMQMKGFTGDGVTVAIVDSGYWAHPAIKPDTGGNTRALAYYDATTGSAVQWIGSDTPNLGTSILDLDPNGHASHLASIIAGSHTSNGDANGVAPDADLVLVKAFGENGGGLYSDIIQGIDWVVKNQDEYDIRVLNLSFSAPPQSYYWEDPLNQAVMQAWQAGIVVVAAAGNTGPSPMTIGVPGNVPYVVTVGALSDNETPDDLTDDFLTDFSSTGPTVEGFVKPEVVAPGAHVLGLMDHNAFLAQNHPTWYTGKDKYYKMWGTS